MLQAVLSKYGVENFIGSHFETYFYQELIFKKFFKIAYFSFLLFQIVLGDPGVVTVGAHALILSPRLFSRPNSLITLGHRG